MIRALVVLTVVVATLPTMATEETPSQCVALLDSPIKLPYVIEAADANAIAERLETSVRSSGGQFNSFSIVEAAVEPVMQNIAAYLQTRKNYPMLFEGQEINAQTSLVSKELAKHLDVLATVRESTPLPLTASTPPPARKPSFLEVMFGRPQSPSPPPPRPSKVDLEQTVLRIRWLHHTLLNLAGEMKALSRPIEIIHAQATDLIRDGETMHRALSNLSMRLHDTDVLIEVKIRIQTLTQDLEMQLQIVRNLLAMLDVRVRYDGLHLDGIRRLLKVQLLHEALHAPTPLDLSPLEPPDPATLAQAEAKSENDEAKRLAVAKERLPLDTFIQSLDSLSSDPLVRNRAIENYLRTYKTVMTVNEVNGLLFRLLQPALSSLKDNLILEYVKARSADLSVDQVCFLADITVKMDGQNAVIEWFARTEFDRLTTDQLSRLGNSLRGDEAKLRHYELMGIGGRNQGR